MSTSTQTPQEPKKPYRDTNKIEIAGQLGQNPEIVALSSGRMIVTGSLASHRNYVKDGQTAKKTNWVPFTYRGDKPEEFANALRKGDQVLLLGTLDYREWIDESTQTKRSTLEVAAFEYKLIRGGKHH